jgi:hypothetical protein
MKSFSRIFNPRGFYRDSVWIVLASAGLCMDRPGLCLGQLGLLRRHPGTNGAA